MGEQLEPSGAGSRRAEHAGHGAALLYVSPGVLKRAASGRGAGQCCGRPGARVCPGGRHGPGSRFPPGEPATQPRGPPRGAGPRREGRVTWREGLGVGGRTWRQVLKPSRGLGQAGSLPVCRERGNVCMCVCTRASVYLPSNLSVYSRVCRDEGADGVGWGHAPAPAPVFCPPGWFPPSHCSPA